MNDSLLCVDRLRVAYPDRSAIFSPETPLSWAVDDVSFMLQPGDRMGLVGESGCGKSTLGRAIMRLLPDGSQTEGAIAFAGKSVLELSPRELQHFRGEEVALVFQDPMTRLDPLMTIGQHCIETLQSHHSRLSQRQAKAQAIATLEAVNIPAKRWSQYPHEFSGGMRQRVAIALALLLNPKLIIADEPTTSLDVTVSAQILQELTRLCTERQMALLLISHDLALVGEYCDRIAVMYNGKFVETGSTQTVLQHPQHPYTRSLLQAALHIQPGGRQEVEGEEDEGNGGEIQNSPTPQSPISNPQSAIPNPPSPSSPSPPPQFPTPILFLRDLSKHYVLETNPIARLFSGADETIRAVDNIRLEVYPGETLGLVGESGCGKSTLSRTILQLIRPTSGLVQFQGQDLTQLSRQQMQQQRRQMQMVFQDPRACLNPMMTVGQSIADPLLIHQLATLEIAKEQVLQMLERVKLVPAEEFYQRYPSELSGGQQQRVAIARALITHPQLVICDEPVSMLDATVQAQVLDLMRELKAEFNLTYLFITHDLWVARSFCDRIAVMRSGQIVELGTTEAVFAQPQHPYTQTLLQAAPLLTMYSIPKEK
ncbi:MAG: ABC transporter ATP-binding protein [Oscillatoriales cyanobacterium C42_A2020_001]|nr:ABC transporter ATP-binding protein [Leptolyngbyaceae cyanobacterium C42_A2020_001]